MNRSVEDYDASVHRINLAREKNPSNPEYTWEQMAEDAGIPLGTQPNTCPCGCRSYRVKGSGTHVSAWVAPEHQLVPQANKAYMDHIYGCVVEQASKYEIKLLAERLMRYAKQ